MNERKPAFKKTERPHPAAPAASAPAPSNGAKARPRKESPATASPRSPRTPNANASNKHKNPGYVQLNARVPAEIRQRLRVLVAQNEDVQLSDHVERALVSYLDSLAR